MTIFLQLLLINGVLGAGLINKNIFVPIRIEHQLKENQKKIEQLLRKIRSPWAKIEQEELQLKEAERLWKDIISQRDFLFGQMRWIANPLMEDSRLEKVKQQLGLSEYYKYKLREFYDKLYPLSQTRERARKLLQEQGRLLTDQILRVYDFKVSLEMDLRNKKTIEQRWQDKKQGEDWIREILGRNYLGPVGQGLLRELLEERQE